MSEMFERFQQFDRYNMSKRAIKRLVALAIALTAAGAILGTVAVVAALANGAITLGGPQVVTFSVERVAWAIAGLIGASLLAGLGTVVAVVAWAGALTNTFRLQDRTWFGFVLVSGLVSLGWVAIIAYAIAGPDSTQTQPARFTAGAAAQG